MESAVVVMAICARAGRPGAFPSPRSATRGRRAPGDGRMISTRRSRPGLARPSLLGRVGGVPHRRCAGRPRPRPPTGGAGEARPGRHPWRATPAAGREPLRELATGECGRSVMTGIDRRIDVLVPAARDLHGRRALGAARPAARGLRRGDERGTVRTSRTRSTTPDDAQDRPQPREVQARGIVRAVVGGRSPPGPDPAGRRPRRLRGAPRSRSRGCAVGDARGSATARTEG